MPAAAFDACIPAAMAGSGSTAVAQLCGVPTSARDGADAPWLQRARPAPKTCAQRTIGGVCQPAWLCGIALRTARGSVGRSVALGGCCGHDEEQDDTAAPDEGVAAVQCACFGPAAGGREGLMGGELSSGSRLVARGGVKACNAP